MSDSFRTLISAALIALVIRCFAFEPFSIPSASMVPTLEVGDFLFVSKFTYGYSAKSSFFGIPLFDGRVLEGHKPARGDVVVFKLPSNTSIDYIKRIIGMPGDRIQMKEGRLYINGAMVPRQEIGKAEIDKNDPVRGNQHLTAIDYVETLPEGRQHVIREEGDARPLDNTVEFTVPEGHYFMMGDNRDNSQDSRVTAPNGQAPVGYVPEDNIVGPARLIFFSLEDGTRFFEFWKWPSAIRGHRLLTSIE